MCFQMLGVVQGIASLAVNTAAQNEAAARQNAQYQQNALVANKNAEEQYAQNYIKQIQEEQKATHERISQRIELMKKRGTAIASSEGYGPSMYSSLFDLERQSARAGNVTDINLDNKKAEIAAETANIKNTAETRIDSVGRASGADPVATAISGLGVVVGGVNDGSISFGDANETGPSGKEIKPSEATFKDTWDK